MGSTYVIGDVHGCFATLQELWRRLEIDLEHDRLWMVGDLVNRGPCSLEVLRWARDLSDRLGERMVVVLGNHDLHLLSRYGGWAGPSARDTLEAILAAPDVDELMQWLAGRPLVHREGSTLLVHAGLLPHWTPAAAEDRARQLEALLQLDETRERLLENYRRPLNEGPLRRERTALRAMTLLRACTAGGEPCPHKGPPEEAPKGCLAWFQVPARRSAAATVVFGHWAALGLRLEPKAIGLDSGCVWGQWLTAVRLEDRKVYQAEARDSG